MKKPEITKLVTKEERKELFERASKQWPTKTLGLVGIDISTGKAYFQEWGNSEQFVLLPVWDGPDFSF